jgi:hypothetical protein
MTLVRLTRWMSQPVTIENDAIRMAVWPQIGGKVTSVVDKADGFDLLFSYPAELPESPCYDIPYGNGWYAGWDECFPAVGASKYVGHPYDGIPVPDHGELWGIPVTTAVPTRDGITTVWHGLRFGYRLARKLYLDGSTLAADYTLVNLAPFEFKFVWAMHSLMSLTSPATLDLGGSTLFRYSHDANGVDIQQPFDWPMLEGLDLSNPQSLPPRRGWKVFSADRIDSPVVVRYPSRGRTLSIEYTSDDQLAAYWGIWINSGGWAGHRHFAVEPTTGRFDQMDRSIKEGSAGMAAPLSRRVWSVRWSLA